VKTLFFIGLLLVSTNIFAQDLDSTHGEWAVYTMKQDGKKVCYIASAPIKEAGNWKSRGERYFLITHRNKSVDEISVSAGYPYKIKSEVKLNIDGSKYKLFTQGELAWAYDQRTDAKIIKAMKKGNKLTSKGYSRLGSHSIDTYSLKGITAAYKKMKKLCR